ncbi:MAG: LPS export ABC transporter periplasmic protein LptC [Rhodobacterales bacterium]|nr:LPS export ABC transporter periplasmic protein LptC [Rhodobacterales bacterium]
MARLDRHSRLVAWLKIVLPLIALAILSTLFLLSRRIDPQDAIPFAEVDVQDRAREPRLTAPAYSGTTRDGAALTVIAAEARPDAGGGASAQRLVARLVAPDGQVTEVTADHADLPQGAGDLVLTGAVTVTTSTGYRIATPRVTAALDRTLVTGDGPVTATGPLGTLTAGGLRLTAEGPERSHVLVFNAGVKLIYRPAPAAP